MVRFALYEKEREKVAIEVRYGKAWLCHEGSREYMGEAHMCHEEQKFLMDEICEGIGGKKPYSLTIGDVKISYKRFEGITLRIRGKKKNFKVIGNDYTIWCSDNEREVVKQHNWKKES